MIFCNFDCNFLYNVLHSYYIIYEILLKGDSMSLFLVIVLIIAGFAMLIFGGNLMVDACLRFSKSTGISKALVGATLVSIITTLPEFFVSVFSTGQGATELAIGNVTGSLLFNFFIVIGIMLLFSSQLKSPTEFKSKIVLALFSLVVLLIFGLDKQLTLAEGLIFLFIFIYFIVTQVIEAKKERFEVPKVQQKYKPWADLAVAVFGAILIVIGARLVVDNGINLGQLLSIPEHIVGVTIIAIGTSLPELVTCIVSIRKKAIALSIGNILGTLTMNITLLMGTNALLTGGMLQLSESVAYISVPLLTMGMAIFGLPLAIKRRFYAWQGVLFIMCALTYYAILII